MRRPEGGPVAIAVDHVIATLLSTGGWRHNRLLQTQQFTKAVAELVTAR